MARRRWDDAVALTADLLVLAAAAGLTPFLALDVVARFGPEPVDAGGSLSMTVSSSTFFCTFGLLPTAVPAAGASGSVDAAP